MLHEVRQRQILYGITYVDSKKYNKLVNEETINRFTDMKNKLVVTSGGERRGEAQYRYRGCIKRIIMRLYEIMCMKLKNCKAAENLKNLLFKTMLTTTKKTLQYPD